MSRDLPIIFSGPMVRAMIDGRKTQTRRLATSPLLKCQPGDRLYVREKWQLHSRASDFCSIVYAASEGRPWTEMHEQFPDELAGNRSPRPFQQAWRPSIHMPRWASRLTLAVERVWTEPLQSISYDDAVAEGVERVVGQGWVDYFDSLGRPIALSARESYATLWMKLHGRDSWVANPQVVAIAFSVGEGNIDRVSV